MNNVTLSSSFLVAPSPKEDFGLVIDHPATKGENNIFNWTRSSSRPPLLAQLASGVVGACASGRRSETYIEGGQTWRSSHDPTMQSAALVLGRFSLGSDF